MPIYEYACTNCNEHTEILQKISDAPATHCSTCNTDSLQKQVSASAFHLKGSGWYVTDFKDKKKSDTPAADSSKPADNTNTKSTTTETKSSD